MKRYGISTKADLGLWSDGHDKRNKVLDRAMKRRGRQRARRDIVRQLRGV